MDFETRGKYREALKAYREVKQAVEHLDSDNFHASPEEDRRNTISNYSSKFHVWRSQIPEELHQRFHIINRLQMYVST